MKQKLFNFLILMPSFIKILYLKRNNKIGENFKLGKGSFLLSSNIILGDNVTIEKRVLIRSKAIHIGDRVTIKKNCSITALANIQINDDCLIDENVTVGGNQSKYSELLLGKRVSIFKNCTINTSRKVEMHDDVGIGGESLIFTHGTWQNTFEGYPYSFGDVLIKQNAWLPWRVFVMPGVTIGKNATIGSASIITKDIPDFTFAAGMPAKNLKVGNEYIVTMNDELRLKHIVNIFTEFKNQILFIKNIESEIIIYENKCKLIAQNNYCNLLYTTDINEAKLFNGYVLTYINSTILADKQFDLLNKKCYLPTDKIGIFIKNFLSEYGIRFDIIKR